MSKGILNNRDKMMWNNTHKPDISDVVAEIDGEMDDLLEDHDDKIVDIVGDNMNDLLDAHDDKVVSIVGDNMSTLLSSNANQIFSLSHDWSGIGTSEGVLIGKWNATNNVYAKRFSGTVTTTGSNVTVDANITSLINVIGYAIRANGGYQQIDTQYGAASGNSFTLTATAGGLGYFAGANFAETGTYEFIVYYLVPITPPTP